MHASIMHSVRSHARSRDEWVCVVIDPNETEKTKRLHEVFQSYRRGWKTGACASPADKRFTEHTRADLSSAYERGYNHGRDASLLSSAKEAERLEYDPRMSILRSPAPIDPPAERCSSVIHDKSGGDIRCPHKHGHLGACDYPATAR